VRRGAKAREGRVRVAKGESVGFELHNLRGYKGQGMIPSKKKKQQNTTAKRKKKNQRSNLKGESDDALEPRRDSGGRVGSPRLCKKRMSVW